MEQAEEEVLVKPEVDENVQLNERALEVIERISAKLTGKDFPSYPQSPFSSHNSIKLGSRTAAPPNTSSGAKRESPAGDKCLDVAEQV